MESPPRFRAVAVGFFLSLLTTATAIVQQEFALRLAPSVTGWELRWQLALSDGQPSPVFEVQRSTDLIAWTTVATGLTSSNGLLRVPVSQDNALAFYRVKSNQQVPLTALGGEEVFGYSRALNQELARLGQISMDTFAAMYAPTTPYLDAIGFDVTTAAYWTNLNSSPPGPYFDTNRHVTITPRDFRLTPVELSLLKQNGFVASARLGAQTCANLYYDIFTRDLPVLITTDSILEAWHRSYDSMLEDLETIYLSGALGDVLSGMTAKLPAIWQAYGAGPLKQSILDADYYLAVARSLLAGVQTGSALGQDALVSTTLTAIGNLQTQPFDLFGRLEKDPLYIFDFSQFKVRGHYNHTVLLQQYFRAMMWCGRVDLRVAGDTNYASPRELGTAMVLLRLAQNSGLLAKWQNMDALLEVMVGRVDSMTFNQLAGLLQAAPVKTLADVKTLDGLQAVQNAIANGALGFQDILADLYFSPLSPAQVKLPRSFTVFGQRFALDSWVLSSVVFDRVIWRTNDIPSFEDKVMRRIPSCLDVAFAVFGNDQLMPDLVARLRNANGRRFRDGLPYQHNLAAVRNVIDSQTAAAWSDNIYNGWLGALRELSAPTTAEVFPQCMRTRAWAMKTLNTQLASWTHLRHDTILYVKQSYTPPVLCSYPAGFVEPVPSFWQRMNLLANRTADLLGRIPMSGQFNTGALDDYGRPVLIDRQFRQATQLACLRNFGQTMASLATMADLELRQEPFSTNQTQFLKDVMIKSVFYAGQVNYSGWYPQLFYPVWVAKGVVVNPDFLIWDALVADVHTDATAILVGDPGMILHEGIGNVNCLVAVIDSGPDRAIYLGPVLSHYEFEEPIDTRLSDQDWQALFPNNQVPPPPDWTKGYFVP